MRGFEGRDGDSGRPEPGKAQNRRPNPRTPPPEPYPRPNSDFSREHRTAVRPRARRGPSSCSAAAGSPGSAPRCSRLVARPAPAVSFANGAATAALLRRVRTGGPHRPGRRSPGRRRCRSRTRSISRATPCGASRPAPAASAGGRVAAGGSGSRDEARGAARGRRRRLALQDQQPLVVQPGPSRWARLPPPGRSREQAVEAGVRATPGGMGSSSKRAARGRRRAACS